MLMLKGIFSSLLPFSNIFIFEMFDAYYAGIEGDQGLEFYANDLFKIWPSISNLVKRKSIRNNFLEFFCKFQSTFKEFG